ncbi:MAG TPA: XRE family transcriptional regulator [Candidatus Mediterraneibacter norfolkensis]|nr:XRE family transcriptional regulator [Candidatus Mediterraneibacter norfolkensis]
MKTISELHSFTTDTEKSDYKLLFHEYISEFVNASPLSVSEIIQKSRIPRTYGYQILNGSRKPGRDKVISLCLTLSLSLKETQRALTIAKESILYPKNKRDSILIFSINKRLSVDDANDLLYELNEKLIE